MFSSTPSHRRAPSPSSQSISGGGGVRVMQQQQQQLLPETPSRLAAQNNKGGGSPSPFHHGHRVPSPSFMMMGGGGGDWFGVGIGGTSTTSTSTTASVPTGPVNNTSTAHVLALGSMMASGGIVGKRKRDERRRARHLVNSDKYSVEVCAHFPRVASDHITQHSGVWAAAVDESGWAYASTFERIFVWQHVSATLSEDLRTPQHCVSLVPPPPSSHNERKPLVSLFCNPSDNAIDVACVSARGLVRYWSGVQEGFVHEHPHPHADVQLPLQADESVSHIAHVRGGVVCGISSGALWQCMIVNSGADRALHGRALTKPLGLGVIAAGIGQQVGRMFGFGGPTASSAAPAQTGNGGDSADSFKSVVVGREWFGGRLTDVFCLSRRGVLQRWALGARRESHIWDFNLASACAKRIAAENDRSLQQQQECWVLDVAPIPGDENGGLVALAAYAGCGAEGQPRLMYTAVTLAVGGLQLRPGSSLESSGDAAATASSGSPSLGAVGLALNHAVPLPDAQREPGRLRELLSCQMHTVPGAGRSASAPVYIHWPLHTPPVVCAVDLAAQSQCAFFVPPMLSSGSGDAALIGVGTTPQCPGLLLLSTAHPGVVATAAAACTSTAPAPAATPQERQPSPLAAYAEPFVDIPFEPIPPLSSPADRAKAIANVVRRATTAHTGAVGDGGGEEAGVHAARAILRPLLFPSAAGLQHDVVTERELSDAVLAVSRGIIDENPGAGQGWADDVGGGGGGFGSGAHRLVHLTLQDKLRRFESFVQMLKHSGLWRQSLRAARTDIAEHAEKLAAATALCTLQAELAGPAGAAQGGGDLLLEGMRRALRDARGWNEDKLRAHGLSVSDMFYSEVSRVGECLQTTCGALQETLRDVQGSPVAQLAAVEEAVAVFRAVLETARGYRVASADEFDCRTRAQPWTASDGTRELLAQMVGVVVQVTEFAAARGIAGSALERAFAQLEGVAELLLSGYADQERHERGIFEEQGLGFERGMSAAWRLEYEHRKEISTSFLVRTVRAWLEASLAGLEGDAAAPTSMAGGGGVFAATPPQHITHAAAVALKLAEGHQHFESLLDLCDLEDRLHALAMMRSTTDDAVTATHVPAGPGRTRLFGYLRRYSGLLSTAAPHVAFPAYVLEWFEQRNRLGDLIDVASGRLRSDDDAQQRDGGGTARMDETFQAQVAKGGKLGALWRVSWLHDIDVGRAHDAASALLEQAEAEQASLATRKLLLSLCKIASASKSSPSPFEFNAENRREREAVIESESQLILAQEMLARALPGDGLGLGGGNRSPRQIIGLCAESILQRDNGGGQREGRSPAVTALAVGLNTAEIWMEQLRRDGDNDCGTVTSALVRLFASAVAREGDVWKRLAESRAANRPDQEVERMQQGTLLFHGLSAYRKDIATEHCHGAAWPEPGSALVQGVLAESGTIAESSALQPLLEGTIAQAAEATM